MDVIELWWLSLAVFAVVVVVVAVLLGLVIHAAKRIDHHASAIWTTGKQIAGNTVSIWMLDETNRQLQAMTKSARSLERSAASIDDRLQGIAAAGRR